ncbi:hypothetical protein BGW41_002031 [Actinomortierella wolfii]|nr:hypothetical protein BGW41_002031 [Actinomortierella wolfii]
MLTHLDKGLLPNLARLKREGAFKEGVRSVNPTDSLPNWMAALSAGPVEFTGVRTNDWGREINNALTSVEGPCGYFPTIFQVVASLEAKKQQQQHPTQATMPDMGAWFFWEKFNEILRPKAYFQALVHVEHSRDQPAVDQAIAYWRLHRPRLSFVYLGEVDSAGHGYGYGEEFTNALIEADRRIGQILQGLDEAHMLPNTTVAVVTDHGRLADGHGHGGTSNLESNTHLFLWGPSTVRRGHNITGAVSILDTSPTILAALGLGPGPTQWRGIPLLDAFLPETEAWQAALAATSPSPSTSKGDGDDDDQHEPPQWSYIEVLPDADDPCQKRLEQGALLPEPKSIPEKVLQFLLAHFDTVYVRGVLSGILFTLILGACFTGALCGRGCYHKYIRRRQGWKSVPDTLTSSNTDANSLPN